MSEDNIVRFPGVTLLDLDPDLILKEAKGRLDKVMILGYTKDGEEEYFAASFADGGTAVWLLERMKMLLLSVVDEDDEDY